MADPGHRAERRADEIVDVPVGHRVNDVIYGHLGRLSYAPAAEGSGRVGDLTSNRIAEPGTSVYEIQPFQEWYPSTKTALPKSSAREWQTRRSQRNWLLRYRPEAAAGTASMTSFFSVADLDATDDEDSSLSALPLLALGEISDVTRGTPGQRYLCIASAVGQANHVLRVATMRSQLLVSGGDVPDLTSASAGTAAEGFWTQTIAPITQLRFVAEDETLGPSRWLVVQKDTSTSLLLPELHGIPSQQYSLDANIPRRSGHHISLNTLLTIKLDESGGCAHSDFSLQFSSDGKPPRLAIVDKAGCWTIWDLLEERRSRSASVRARFIARGTPEESVGREAAIQWSSSPTTCRVAWTQSAPPFRQEPLGPASEAELRAKHDVSSTELLLTTSTETVQIADTVTGPLRCRFRLVDRNSVEHIVDSHICPLDPSQVFVLTTARLYWLKIEQSNNVLRPTIALSCPHWRGSTEERLKLAVSALRGATEPTCCVFVYSSSSLVVDTFWFACLENGHFRHQIIPLSAESMPSGIQIQTLAVWCSALAEEPAFPGSRLHEHMHGSGAAIFQVVVLATDLSVHAAVYGCTNRPGRRKVVVVNSGPEPASDRRKVTAFVVPDNFATSESVDTLEQTTLPARQSPRRSLQPALRNQHTINLQPLVRHITRQDLDERKEAGELTQGDITEEAEAIHREIERVAADGEPAFRILSEFGRASSAAERYRVADAMASTLQGLNSHPKNAISSLQLSAHVLSSDVQRLYQSLSRIWSADAADASSTASGASSRVQAIKEMAGDVFSAGTAIKIAERRRRAAQPQSHRNTGPEASSQAGTAGTEKQAEEHVGPDDAAVARLRALTSSAITPPAATAKQRGRSRFLSHWPEKPGSDPWQYKWLSEHERRLEAELARRQGNEQAREKRRAAKRLALGVKERPAVRPSSQPLPRLAGSSQASQEIPGLSEPLMSQPVAGPFGGPVAPARKKLKTGSGRKAGFK